MNNYEKILESMKNRYCELSGREVPQLSDIDIRLKILAGEIYKEQVNLEYIKRQMFVQTAESQYLDYHASERGITRKPAIKAKGKVRFILTAPLEVSLTIPKGTVVSSSGSNPRRYVTDKDATVEAGKKSITIPCTAEQGGADSNAVIGAVDVLITTVVGIEVVTNTYAFTGGADAESDESLRQRVIESFSTISNGTNKAYYKSLALSVDTVTGAGVIPRVRGVGTVDVYICTGKETASDNLVAKVQEIMSKERELNVDVQVQSANKVTASLGIMLEILPGYNYSDVANEVTEVVFEYINSLSVGDSLYGNYVGKLILDVEGVCNYTYSGFYDSDYIIEDDSFLVLGTLDLEEMV